MLGLGEPGRRRWSAEVAGVQLAAPDPLGDTDSDGDNALGIEIHMRGVTFEDFQVVDVFVFGHGKKIYVMMSFPVFRWTKFVLYIIAR